MARSGYQAFQQEAPEVAEAFSGLIGALISHGGLDAKTSNLIYIAAKASTGDPGAALAHVPFAKAAGASREEVRGAILLTLTIAGLKGINLCLADALDAYDRA